MPPPPPKTGQGFNGLSSGAGVRQFIELWPPSYLLEETSVADYDMWLLSCHASCPLVNDFTGLICRPCQRRLAQGRSIVGVERRGKILLASGERKEPAHWAPRIAAIL